MNALFNRSVLVSLFLAVAVSQAIGDQECDSMVIVGSNRAPGSASQWADVAVGDVTGDGRIEVVGARNYDGDIFVWQIAPNGTFTNVGAHVSPGSGSQWAGLDIGNVTGAGNEMPSVPTSVPTRPTS